MEESIIINCEVYPEDYLDAAIQKDGTLGLTICEVDQENTVIISYEWWLKMRAFIDAAFTKERGKGEISEC